MTPKYRIRHLQSSLVAWLRGDKCQVHSNRNCLWDAIDSRVISSSGSPYRTPKGHTPAWVDNVCAFSAIFFSLMSSQVDWQKGDAFNPNTFAHLFPRVDGVVHTLGILLEDGEYKQAVRDANIPQLLSSLFRTVTGDTGNPLRKGSAPGGDRMTYESMNKKAGSDLRVLCSLLLHLPLTQLFMYAKHSSPLRLLKKILITRGHLFTSLQKISSDPSFLRGTSKQNARQNRKSRG